MNIHICLRKCVLNAFLTNRGSTKKRVSRKVSLFECTTLNEVGNTECAEWREVKTVECSNDKISGD